MAITSLAWFDTAYYLQQYPDVAASYTGAPVNHYITTGYKEGRAPAAWFDATYYRSTYADLANMDALTAFNHYITQGWKEARVPSAGYVNFDAVAYKAQYPDLANLPNASALGQYVLNGITEQRLPVFTGGTNEASVSYVLTTGQDIITGTSGQNYIRGVAGATLGTQDQTTLNSSDNIDGGNGSDTIIINMTGPAYTGGARIKNVETLQIGTDILPGAIFDYNVNAGANEITDVTKIVYDQIVTGEALSVRNILRTNAQAPTVAWYNNSSTVAAGTAVALYQGSELNGTSDNQNIDLSNVTNGQLVIGRGFETFTVTNVSGSGPNTLAALSTDNFTGQPASARYNADLVSDATAFTLGVLPAANTITSDGVDNNSTLTKVVLNTTAQIGNKGSVITGPVTTANVGFVNHSAAQDNGFDATSPTTMSNLLSVAATVTEVDASGATAATNVRFTPRVNGVAVDVTFKGGSDADYVEFEAGNVTAAGNKGSDIFSFNTPGAANAGFTSADVLTGGEGADTIQLGVNAGVNGGTRAYVLNTTEFNNKTGIEVLDLRGATSDVSLSDSFVAAADTGVFTVNSNKIAQASDTDASDSTTSVNLAVHQAEVSSSHYIDITSLGANRAITINGGTGTEVVFVDNDAMNQSTTIALGTNSDNVDNTGRGRGVTTRNDSIIFVNGGTFDANDLSKTTGVDLFDLVQNTTSTDTWNFTLTESFLRGVRSTTSGDLSANTLALRGMVAVNNASGGPSGAVLNAGDVVNIDVTDFYDANGVLKTSLGGNAFLNLADVIASGATVTAYRVTAAGNVTTFAAAGGTVTTAATYVNSGVPVGTVGTSVTTSGNIGTTNMTVFSDTVTASTALALTVDSLAGNDILTGSTAADYLQGNAGNDTILGGVSVAADTLDGGTGNDTITIGSTGVAHSVLAGAGDDTISAGAFATALMSIDGGTGTDTFNITMPAAATAINGLANVEIVNVTPTGATALTTIDAVVAPGATLTVNNLAAFVLTFTGTAELDGAFNITGNTAADIISGSTCATIGDTITTGGGGDSVFGDAGADTINHSGVAAANLNGGLGADTYNLAATATGADVIYMDGAAAADSNISGWDIINGASFNGAGTKDTVKVGNANVLVLTATTIAAATTLNLATEIQAKITAGATFAANTDALYITVTSYNGGGAATFVAVNSDGVAGIQSTDVFFQLVGATGTLGANDIIL